MGKHNELSTHHVRMSSILNCRDREVGGKLEKGRGNKKERGRGREGGSQEIEEPRNQGIEEEKQMLTGN